MVDLVIELHKRTVLGGLDEANTPPVPFASHDVFGICGAIYAKKDQNGRSVVSSVSKKSVNPVIATQETTALSKLLDTNVISASEGAHCGWFLTNSGFGLQLSTANCRYLVRQTAYPRLAMAPVCQSSWQCRLNTHLPTMASRQMTPVCDTRVFADT
eukprot:465017_1